MKRCVKVETSDEDESMGLQARFLLDSPFCSFVVVGDDDDFDDGGGGGCCRRW